MFIQVLCAWDKRLSTNTDGKIEQKKEKVRRKPLLTSPVLDRYSLEQFAGSSYA